MNATERLKAALAPLAERTMRRIERIKQLQAQPQTEQTVKAIAAEQREIALFKQVANEAGLVVESIVSKAQQANLQAQTVVGRVQEVAENASHYERLFHFSLDHAERLAEPVPDEKWPPAAAQALRSMFMIDHMRSSPETYAATFPTSRTYPPLPTA